MNTNGPPRSHSAQVQLYRDGIYVFSDMLVNRLGRTPLRLEAQFEAASITPLDLGKAVRRAIDKSLPWVEREEFEARYDPLGDPISQAFGIPNKDLNKAGKQSGRVTVGDWPNKTYYECTAWIKKGTSGKPSAKEYPVLPKECSDEQLGVLVLEQLRDSLTETLAANKK
ncbi:hypothetical protein [Lysobacter capsici]|uniref:hypothetical protein n=1 Tax=Lysobacter capsici TaxID=435897 RepID=UPI00128CAF09|nr:hypothetical protein [Lysobacter capsici]